MQSLKVPPLSKEDYTASTKSIGNTRIENLSDSQIAILVFRTGYLHHGHHGQPQQQCPEKPSYNKKNEKIELATTNDANALVR